MIRKEFPIKKRGDTLSHRHVNSLGAAISEISSKRPGTYFSGKYGENHSRHPFELYNLEITNLKINVNDTDDSGLYLAKARYYSFADSEWKSGDAELEVDARDTFLSFQIADESTNRAGHRISAFWDEQRGMFVPLCRIWPPQEQLAIVSAAYGIEADSSGEVQIKRNGAVSDPLETETAFFDHMAVGTAGNGQECVIRWIDDRMEWVIVELECEA